jgi:two-component system CheB/CheR fusion protein
MNKSKKISRPKEPEKNGLFIVGIGASAGGVQALQEFFQHVSVDSGMSYVVILHLSPNHDSKLAEILQHVISIPVLQITEKEKVEANHIYIIPPSQHLTMSDGFITVTPNTTIEDRRAPVDIFFRSLADSHGAKAVCVILSGTGANGSMGLKRIKENGGAAFVQSPREAEFNEMPRNAIATNMIDDILPVAAIPGRIIAYGRGFSNIHNSAESKALDQSKQHALKEIFAYLRLRTGHDFTNYKRPTLFRRLERRVNIRALPDLPSYVTYLKDNPDEISALLKDLLISVTNFFRDKKAYEFLEKEIIPRIIENKKSDNQVRIWVAGCATGEEAYSLAMLCSEKTLGVIDAPKIQIFATDIDESAILQAREGLYTLNDAADVSPERLRRFFNKEGEQYRVRREIREMILFAIHNFIKDPPFFHLDLISCRNVMIYLNQVAQARAMETFHFALNPGKFLFLGTSESVEGNTDLFAVYNREAHIFQSREASVRSYPVPEPGPSFHFGQTIMPTLQQEKKVLERITFSDLHHRLLEEYAPPSIIINEDYDIVHLSGNAGKYLHVAGGEISQNLLKMVKEELRLELRSALYQAIHKKVSVETKGLKVRVNSHLETVNIKVRPVLRKEDTARGFILVLFEPLSNDTSDKEIVYSPDEPVSRHLEDELIRVKIELKNAVEQHEFQEEELKASNEELQAMNEELRSAAEELETSKEELQSINEELRTVNQELKVKIEEANVSTNDLQNLVNSADIGTLFLDRSFRVSLFTPAARNIFNLIPSDYGRPLSDITNKLNVDNLLHDAEKVLNKLTVIEREVSTKENLHYLMRLMPYRTTEDYINGVVITFLDITNLKKVQGALQQSLSQLESFNYLASHDLREPLRKIQTYVNLLNKDIGNENKLILYLESINESSQRMTQLIDDLLAFSRLSRPGDAFQKVDLNKILDHVKTDYEIAINEKQAIIKSGTLPVVHAIPYQMHQLFANLLSNALKFNKNRPEIIISSSTIKGEELKDKNGIARVGKYAEITVSDNGIGFDNQYSKRIFELFQRLHSKSEYSGTGMGLGIVDRIVKNHKGFLKAEGIEGKGAKFTIWLPANSI